MPIIDAKSQIERDENKKDCPTYYIPYRRNQLMADVFLY